MSKPTAEPDEFASAMQQLSEEAKKTSITPAKPAHAGGLVVQEQQSLEERIDNLEATLSKKMEEMVTTISRTRNREVSVQFQKVEEQLASIRNTESVNQRLFDSLHDELLKYRDNFVHESLQKPFIHDLVHLFDDLSALASQLQSSNDQAKKPGSVGRWYDNLQNSIHSLLEVLHRLDVKEVEQKEMVDRTLHRVVSYEPADFPEDNGRIVMRLKRGFLWRDQLIRAEDVIAKRFE